MDPITILAAGVASGTVLLFAAVGEIFAERAGVINLGVEGMMLIGAVVAFGTAVATGDPWLGLVLGTLAGGLLSVLHAVITISFQAEQVVSGLALTFLGTGLARVLGEDLSKAGAIALLPTLTIPGLTAVPAIGQIFFTDQSVLVYVGYAVVPIAWYWINRTRPGLHLRAVGESRPPRTRSASTSTGCDMRMSSSGASSRASPGRRSRWPSHPAGSAT
jgi:simple sugar transport system permease protein